MEVIQHNPIVILDGAHNIDGIMTVASDVPMQTIAAVCECMGLNGINKRTALNATNKAEMRMCLDKAGVPIPRYFVADNLDEFIALCSNFDKKFVVKASDNSGNRGVSLVDDPLDKDKLISAFKYAKENTRDGRVLLEDYMDGKEFSVEGISVGGVYHVIQVTDKITTGAPYFVEMGHTQPSAENEEVLNNIQSVAKNGVAALGILDGPSHTEIKLTSDGPKIVEIGARLGGGCITTHLVPLSTGIDMVGANINIALGQTPDISHKYTKGSAIRFFKCEPGVFSGITGVEKASSLKGVIEIGFLKNIGDNIEELKTGLDRVGYVIAQGESREEAARICEDALNMIKIITE
jgi:biotin carboxylase